MKRKQVLTLGITVAGCILVLLVLYAFSPMNSKIYRGNFDRKFLPEPTLKQEATLDLKVNSFYFAGATSDKIYLGNSTNPFFLLITNSSLTDSQHVKLNLVGIDSLKQPGKFKITVDSPYFYVAHSTMAELLRGRIGDWNAHRFMPDSADYFIDAVPIGSSSFAMRVFNDKTKEYDLAKKQAKPPYFQVHEKLLEKQVDGLFCLDGQLIYNKALNRIIYMHFYRNEIVVADTNLNLLHRWHSIDAFDKARVKVSHIKSRNEFMLSEPPVHVNNSSCASGDKLFVQSNILSYNEPEESLLDAYVIDVYALDSVNYQYSFYIPRFNGKSIKEFNVFNSNVYVISEHTLLKYSLRNSPNTEIIQ
jgi:hypothetical protein